MEDRLARARDVSIMRGRWHWPARTLPRIANGRQYWRRITVPWSRIVDHACQNRCLRCTKDKIVSLVNTCSRVVRILQFHRSSLWFSFIQTSNLSYVLSNGQIISLYTPGIQFEGKLVTRMENNSTNRRIVLSRIHIDPQIFLRNLHRKDGW